MLISIPAGERLYVQPDAEVPHQAAEQAAQDQQQQQCPQEHQPGQPATNIDCMRVLNNWAQSQRLAVQVTFANEGPNHAATWRCRLQVGDRVWTSGPRRSKKEAKKDAAAAAWQDVSVAP